MRRRLVAFFSLFILIVGFYSSSAFAMTLDGHTSVEQYPPIGGENYVVSPIGNRFSAALWLIGEESRAPQITNPQGTLLSNEGTGGAFYDLAMEFDTLGSNRDNFPDWAHPWDLLGPYIPMMNCARFFGGDSVWYVHADYNQIANARRDFLKVINGEAGGGGGSYSDTIFTYYWPVSQSYSTIFKTDYTFSPREVSASVSLLSSQVTFSCPSSLFANVPISEYDRVWVFDRSSNNYRCYCLERGSYSITSETFSYGDSAYITKGKLTWTKTGYLCNGWKSGNTSGSFFSKLTFDGSVLGVDIPDDSVFTSINAVAPSNVTVNYGWIGSSYYMPPVNHWPNPGEPAPTPGPQPDPPDVPGPPDLPGPPQNPTIDPDPDPVPDPTGTTPADYTPWLRAILNALNRLIIDLANHCLHIRNYIRTCTLYIASCFSHLEGYIRDCFEWLASQFSFDSNNESFDDSQLLLMLRHIYDRLGGIDSAISDLSAYLGDIYARLGDLDSAVSDLSAQLGDIYIRLGQILGKIGSGGGGRPAPTTEPEVDEGFDFWQWLLDLISSKLDAIIEDFVGDIGGFLSELVTKFPFSIPWDIAAYLTLLDAQRVTPVISFVIPAIDGWWGEVPITVNLQPYDNAMSAVRSMMLILWGFWLLFKTDWLGGVFDFATKSVTSFLDRLVGHGGGD